MAQNTQWQQQNDRYLDTAIAWLRFLLAHRVKQERIAKEDEASIPDFLRRIDENKVKQAEAAMAEAAQADPPPALEILRQVFGLSRFERDLLLLCVAVELDKHTRRLCANLYPLKPYPTFELALSLFATPSWNAISPKRPLRYWQLLEIYQPSGVPLAMGTLQANERVMNYIKGLADVDDRLTGLLVPLEIPAELTPLPPSQQVAVDRILQRLHVREGPNPLIQLVGSDAQSQQLVAWYAAAELGLQLYRLPVELLPAQASELEVLVRLWEREQLLLPVALYLDAQEAEGAASGGETSSLQRFLVRSTGLLFLGIREARQRPGRSSITVDVAKPTPQEQREAWGTELRDVAPESAALLAGQFSLNVSDIRDIARVCLADSGDGDGGNSHANLWEACLAKTRPKLDALAQRVEANATWDDIVLPEKELKLLRQLTEQVRQRSQVYESWGFHRRMNRGLGVNALFAGDSGTGKTMAAEVIANDLRLNLYRIDLSAVVSKYIGETEKNLRRLFDAAEEGGAILFFDEADALFGKRSEVKDSHDRYANIEINYLLQRMEGYCGVAILATNFKRSLDKAFWRRLRFAIQFPFPAVEERQSIWQRVFPPETPTVGLDYGHLARFNLTGGSVHNVALNAAFMAAGAGTPVTMPLVLEAIRTEYDKLERPINEADFSFVTSSNGMALLQPGELSLK